MCMCLGLLFAAFDQYNFDSRSIKQQSSGACSLVLLEVFPFLNVSIFRFIVTLKTTAFVIGLQTFPFLNVWLTAMFFLFLFGSQRAPGSSQSFTRSLLQWLF
ncbi:hypothetical protein VPH35_033362 [Triticum aestivum]